MALMNSNSRNFVRLLGAAVVLCAPAILWVGCKGNSSPGPANQLSGTTLPALHAWPAATNLLAANPLTDAAWRKAPWVSLSLPLNDSRPVPPTRAAIMYDPKHLYVAFICSTTDDATRAPSDDTAELWLDTSAAGDGREFLSVIVNRQGSAAVTWYRTDLAPQPNEDGSPNFLHPFRILSNYKVPGLQVKAAPGLVDGAPVWTATLDIPMFDLPTPLQSTPKPGASWRANLIRTNIVTTASRRAILQSNFAPVQAGAQSVAPYRMAELFLDSTPTFPPVAANQPRP